MGQLGYPSYDLIQAAGRDFVVHDRLSINGVHCIPHTSNQYGEVSRGELRVTGAFIRVTYVSMGYWDLIERVVTYSNEDSILHGLLGRYYTRGRSVTRIRDLVGGGVLSIHDEDDWVLVDWASIVPDTTLVSSSNIYDGCDLYLLLVGSSPITWNNGIPGKQHRSSQTLPMDLALVLMVSQLDTGVYERIGVLVVPTDEMWVQRGSSRAD